MTVLKLIMKIVIAPVILLLTLAIWICVGLVYVSGLVLGLLSTVIAFLGCCGASHIFSAKRPYPAADRISHKPLWAAEAGLLAAGQGAGFEICNSGFGLWIRSVLMGKSNKVCPV